MATNVLSIRKPDGFHNGSTVNVMCAFRRHMLLVPASIELPNMALVGAEKAFRAGTKIVFGPSGNRQQIEVTCKACSEVQLGIEFQNKLNEALAGLPKDVTPAESLISNLRTPKRRKAAEEKVVAVV